MLDDGQRDVPVVQHLQCSRRRGYPWPWPVRHDCFDRADFEYAVFKEHISCRYEDAEARMFFLEHFENYKPASYSTIRSWARKWGPMSNTRYGESSGSLSLPMIALIVFSMYVVMMFLKGS